MQLLPGAIRDLGGGFNVRRMLPAAGRRAVGPFVFFDHFGPVDVTPDSRFDVRPHPHIGLATVTYLFEGAMLHRDSLGSVQRIEPGAINWMNAGRGIVHSERRPEDLARKSYRKHGLQLWVALPSEQEESAPAFAHTPAAAIPELMQAGVRVRVLVGEAWGRRSPVESLAPTLYIVASLPAGARWVLPPLARELALYAVDAPLIVDGEAVGARQLAVIDAACSHEVRVAATAGTANGNALVTLIGGDPLDAPRSIWWNFVSSRPERIRQAADDWEAGRMTAVPGETEFIPLPERPPAYR